jgi:undecaprenyl-diphosphatase
LLAALLLPLLTLTLLRFLPHPTMSNPNDLDAAFNAFPVSYISVATSVYVFAAVLLAREIRPRFRLVVYLVVSTLLGSIAIALLYLGRGWPLFLLGGVTLGLVWAALLGIAYRRHITEKPKQPRHLAVALMSLLIVPWLFPVQSTKSTTSVAEQQPSITITAAEWKSRTWRELPAVRDDLRHRHDHPLNLQWAGTPTAIEQTLTSLGWQPAPPFAAQALLQWLNPNPELSAMPILPHVHNGRYESLRWIKPASAKAWYIIRLWPGNYEVTTGVDTVPLWIGNVGYLRLERTGGLSVLRTTTDFTGALEVLKDEVLVSSQTHKNAYKGGLISGRIVDGRLLLQTENELQH